MRNTAKYTKMCSGFVPRFTEGDVFETVIPLSEVATVTVGPVRAAEKLCLLYGSRLGCHWHPRMAPKVAPRA